MSQFAAFLRFVRRSIPFSLRLQLATWYTLAFAILLLLTGAVFYQYLESSLEASIDTDLQIRAQQIAGDLVLQQGTRTLPERILAIPGLNSSSNSADLPAVDVNQGTLVRLLDAQGHLLAETPSFSTLLVPQASVTQPLEGQPWQGTVHAANSHQEIRLYSRVLRSANQPVAVIQVAESLANLHALLHQLVAALLCAGFLVLAFCALGSYWLAGRSFVPMQHLAETARKIKGGNLHERVPVPPVRDEVQYLAVTLNEMLDSLEQAFSQQRRFVADASHELRTPVTVIRNKAEVALLNARSPQEYAQVLQSISAETERLGRLINDLLILARGDEGKARFEREQVDLTHLVEAVIAHTNGLAQQRQIQLSLKCSQPVLLLGDEARLIQVAMNLLDNAIRYTHVGGAIQVRVLEKAGEAWLIVQDNGIGIAPEHLPHIFERFYRADPSRTRTVESGTGLGLSMVEWIVRIHNGSISVESEPGAGSCFTVRLPVA